MPVTDDELVVARSWIGETETVDTFNERFDRIYLDVVVTRISDSTVRRAEAVNRAIEESLRSQLSVMTLDGPSSASADGNSYSNVQNLVTLQKTLQEFSTTKGTKQATIVHMRRCIGR